MYYATNLQEFEEDIAYLEHLLKFLSQMLFLPNQVTHVNFISKSQQQKHFVWGSLFFYENARLPPVIPSHEYGFHL